MPARLETLVGVQASIVCEFGGGAFVGNALGDDNRSRGTQWLGCAMKTDSAEMKDARDAGAGNASANVLGEAAPAGAVDGVLVPRGAWLTGSYSSIKGGTKTMQSRRLGMKGCAMKQRKMKAALRGNDREKNAREKRDCQKQLKLRF